MARALGRSKLINGKEYFEDPYKMADKFGGLNVDLEETKEGEQDISKARR